MKVANIWEIEKAQAQELINCPDGTQADPSIGCVGTPANITQSETSLAEIILSGASHLMTVVAAIAVVMLMWAAIQYALAAGDGEKISRSKRNMLWSVLGLGIAIVAKIAVRFLLSSLA